MYLVYATMTTKPGREAEFEDLLAQLAGPTRAEPGALLYVFGRGQTAGSYMMAERYVDKQAFKAHFETAHFKQLGDKIADCLIGPPTMARCEELS